MKRIACLILLVSVVLQLASCAVESPSATQTAASETVTNDPTATTDISINDKIKNIDFYKTTPLHGWEENYWNYYCDKFFAENGIMPSEVNEISDVRNTSNYNTYYIVHAMEIPRWMMYELICFCGLDDVYDDEYLNVLYTETSDGYIQYMADNYESFVKKLMGYTFETMFAQYLYSSGTDTPNIKFVDDPVVSKVFGFSKESIDNMWTYEGQAVPAERYRAFLWMPISEGVKHHGYTYDEYREVYLEFKKNLFRSGPSAWWVDSHGLGSWDIKTDDKGALYYEYDGIVVYAADMPSFSWRQMEKAYYDPEKIEGPKDIFEMNRNVRID